MLGRSESDMSDVDLIGGLRRNAAGVVTHVAWCRRESPQVAPEVCVADVIDAIPCRFASDTAILAVRYSARLPLTVVDSFCCAFDPI